VEADRLDAVALVTGAGSGIGAAVVRDIARRSEGGIILIDLDEDALAAVADDLEQNNAAPERVSMLAFDVADQDRWREAAEFIRAQYGRLDWAIVNAGVSTSADTDLVDWGRASELDSALLMLRAVIPLMRGNIRGGRVVVSAPAAAIKAEPSGSAYSASKAGLLQLMRVAAKEGAPDNISVNAIATGGAETPMWSSMPWFQDLVLEAGSERGAFERIAGLGSPLARCASPIDLARLIIMLLSDDAPITGATLVVDRGHTL
jgi:NAD(P)-dependent dehydrogenase (short-subunit alcohol dehydrogenase family)